MTKPPRGAFTSVDEWIGFTKSAEHPLCYHSPAPRRGEWNGSLPFGIQKLRAIPDTTDEGNSSTIRFRVEDTSLHGLHVYADMRVPWGSGRSSYIFKNFWDAYAHACQVEAQKNER